MPRLSNINNINVGCYKIAWIHFFKSKHWWVGARTNPTQHIMWNDITNEKGREKKREPVGFIQNLGPCPRIVQVAAWEIHHISSDTPDRVPPHLLFAFLFVACMIPHPLVVLAYWSTKCRVISFSLSRGIYVRQSYVLTWVYTELRRYIMLGFAWG